jgi:hypothetical protein
MNHRTIVVDTTGPSPLQSVEPKLGAVNLGLYCRSDDCGEFISFGALPDGASKSVKLQAQPAGSPIYVECPSCHSRQRRHSEEFDSLHLERLN